jgi:quinol monooxygenase YgiN
MILIVLNVEVRAEQRETFLTNIRRYTEAVRAEEGNLSFECFESIDVANRCVIVEGFASREAGDVHVRTEHFADFMGWFPEVIARAPTIINVEVPDGWSEMAELAPKA